MPASDWDREYPLEELLRLRDLGEGRADAASQFFGIECRVAVYALVTGRNALARGEILGALYCLRLICETAIRIRWLIGDSDDVADSEGRLAVDAATVATRFARLRKRDLMHLRAAYAAIGSIEGGSKVSSDTDLGPLIEKLTDLPAPKTIAEMAVAKSAQRVYAMHRLCSSLIHPGAVLGRRPPMSVEDATSRVTDSAVTAAAWADGCLSALGELRR